MSLSLSICTCHGNNELTLRLSDLLLSTPLIIIHASHAQTFQAATRLKTYNDNVNSVLGFYTGVLKKVRFFVCEAMLAILFQRRCAIT